VKKGAEEDDDQEKHTTTRRPKEEGTDLKRKCQPGYTDEKQTGENENRQASLC